MIELKIRELTGRKSQTIQIGIFSESEEPLATLNISDASRPTRMDFHMSTYSYFLKLPMTILETVASFYNINTTASLRPLGLTDYLTVNLPSMRITVL